MMRMDVILAQSETREGSSLTVKKASRVRSQLRRDAPLGEGWQICW